MGRVLRHEVIAIRCELRSCGASRMVSPFSIHASRREQMVQLEPAVMQGWSLVLTPQLRSYCPLHRDRAGVCSCRTNPDRAHLCTVHDPEAALLIWRAGEQAGSADEPDALGERGAA